MTCKEVGVNESSELTALAVKKPSFAMVGCGCKREVCSTRKVLLPRTFKSVLGGLAFSGLRSLMPHAVQIKDGLCSRVRRKCNNFKVAVLLGVTVHICS